MCPDTAQGLGGGPRAPKSAGERPKMLESAREWPESGPRAPESARSNQLLICHMHAYIYIYIYMSRRSRDLVRVGAFGS